MNRVGFSASLPQYVNRRGDMLHFRMRVPDDIRECLGMTEVRLSLRTNYPREAGKKAQRLAWVADKAFRNIRRGKYGPMADLDREQVRQFVIGWLRRELENCEIDKATRTKRATERSFEEEEMTLDSAFDQSLNVLHESQHLKAYKGLCRELLEGKGLDIPEGSVAFALLCREVAKGVTQLYATMKKRHHEDYTPPKETVLWFPEVYEKGIQQQGPAMPVAQEEEKDYGPLLSEVLDAYQSEKMRQKEWDAKTELSNVAMIRDFIELTTDKPIGLLTPKDIREAKENTSKLPSNRSKKAGYRDKTVAQILKMNIPEEDRLSLRTLNNRGTMCQDICRVSLRW